MQTRTESVANRLHQTVGNRALQRLLLSRAIQPKLTVSEPGDAYEREADHVADQVMRMTAAGGLQKIGSAAQVQRKCAQCDEENAQKLQDEQKVMRAAHGASSATVSGNVLPAGGGQSLSKPTRSFFEPRFGYDFSAVRIHTDARAHEAARSINASAYTVGQDVVFEAGRYAPDSTAGRHLLAHELTHVVQQSGGAANSDLKLKRQASPMVQREACESLAPPNCDGGTCEEGAVCGGNAGDWPVCFCRKTDPYRGGGGESGGGGSSDDF